MPSARHCRVLFRGNRCWKLPVDMDICLPAELQRDIFELAIRVNPKDADLKLNLSLVAPHIRLWVDQVFYESVVISSRESGEKFLSLIEAKPPGFFATAVKSLLIDPLLSDEQTVGILTACRGVESLALWGTTSWGHIPDFPYLVNQLPLRRLSVKYFHLETSIAFDPPPTWLSSLTHLDMAFVKPLMFSADRLALHFTLHPSIASAVSTNCPGLQVLVIIFDWSSSIPAWADKRYSFDDRIVVVQRVPSSSSEDWEAAHFGLSNVWTRAESAVAERRRAAGG